MPSDPTLVSDFSLMRQRVLIVGCGAIGGILGARLTRAGIDVIPVTGNDAITTALENGGFRVEELDGTSFCVPCTSPPRTTISESLPLGPLDLCIVTTKTTTLASALADIAPTLDPETPVLLCQNGLPEEFATLSLSRTHILGCVVGFGGTLVAPGYVQQTSHGVLQIGRPFLESPPVEPTLDLLRKALPALAVQDLSAVRWSKLAINAATSTLGVIGGDRLGPLLRRRFVRRLALELWTEVTAVAQAQGVTMAPVAGTFDIAKLALTEQECASSLGSPLLALKHSVLLAVGMKFRNQRSSMLAALERGREPEIDMLNGEIVRRGAALGIPTPVNTLLVHTVERLFARELTPSVELLRRVFVELHAASSDGAELAA